MFENQVIEEFSVGNSSMTDSDHLSSYPSLCGLASNDPEIFKKFRSSTAMVEALDHVTIDQGKLYLKEIVSHGPWNEHYLSTIRRIDSIGHPRLFSFPPYGTMSPTLIRYLKVYLDLRKYFGSIEKMNIAEIGVGFGGQASVIHMLDKPESYTFYDIPPVLKLVDKFIGELEIQGKFNFIDGRNPIASTPDLVISNYAFSELSLEVQNVYLHNVILKSPRGYITWNSQSVDNLDGHSLADLVRIIPNSQIMTEKPNTSENNVIITWNN